MINIKNVTAYLAKIIEKQGGDVSREVLNIIPTQDGSLYYKDEQGNCFRAYDYITGAVTFEQVDNPEVFYKTAKAFGKFQKQLSNFPADSLFETIPDFHNTEKRYYTFSEAVKKDEFGRAAGVKAEIDFVNQRKADTKVLVNLLKEKKLPLRVTHNDTKLNNVMIDEQTLDAICIIDLDTVLPGLVCYDFGDSIRFGASTAAEDEQDLSKVSMNLDLFEIYAKGFLEVCGNDLTDAELEYLAYGAKVITLECGIRFLTDYLNGDKYFKISRENHNLDRCRTQFKLVSDMEQKMDRMNAIVKEIAQKVRS